MTKICKHILTEQSPFQLVFLVNEAGLEDLPKPGDLMIKDPMYCVHPLHKQQSEDLGDGWHLVRIRYIHVYD